MDHPFISPTIISYCTGIRGLERGIERSIGPFRTAAYVEIEAFIIENLLAGMETGFLDAAPIWANLKTFNARPFRGKVHGIIGGYPCQPFSTAGNRKGTEDPRHLWPYLERDIRAIEPVWCFFENVSGHLSLGYRDVRQSLEGLGYSVKEGIFTAEEVGAPHKRERLFILAIRKDCMGYIQYNGSTTASESRRSNKASIRSQKGKDAPSEFEGASRPCSDRGLSSNELADSIGVNRRLPEPKEWNESIQVAWGGEKLVYSSSSNVSGDKTEQYDTQNRQEQRERQTGSSAGWPARPNEQQYEWEEPRTVKPGLGCTIDGYNFREDLLRAYGNGVVEQTAELAFTTLLRQHYADWGTPHH